MAFLVVISNWHAFGHFFHRACTNIYCAWRSLRPASSFLARLENWWFLFLFLRLKAGPRPSKDKRSLIFARCERMPMRCAWRPQIWHLEHGQKEIMSFISHKIIRLCLMEVQLAGKQIFACSLARVSKQDDYLISCLVFLVQNMTTTDHVKQTVKFRDCLAGWHRRTRQNIRDSAGRLFLLIIGLIFSILILFFHYSRSVILPYVDCF